MLTPIGRRLLQRWIYVMVKSGPDFVVPYTPGRRERVAGDAAYGPAWEPFLERFLSALDGPGWPTGSYFPGGWFRQIEARGEAPARAAIRPEALGPFRLPEVLVDRQGRWFVGSKPIEGRILQHFLRHLHYDDELARYLIRYRLERHFESRYLHHLSPPIRVRRVTLEGGSVMLRLNTGAAEPLRPETLRMDGAEQLYCAVGEAGLPAWFEEPARWELLKDADQREGAWVLQVAGRELAAPLHAPWTYADALPA